MLYPEGYLDAMKINETTKKRPASNEKAIKKSKKFKKQIFDLEDELKILIKNDKANAKLWAECKATLIDGKPAFLDCVSER